MAEMQRVTELGFADFVAMLLVETLDAIVASHTSQEERLRALATAAGQDVDTFAESITDEVLDAALTQFFPDGTGGTALIEGGGAPSPEDLEALGLTLSTKATTGRRLTADGVREVREGVRQHLARTHQQSLREVARHGVPRVVVDRGVLRSKLTFSALRRDDDSGPATGTLSSSTLTALSTPLRDRYLPLLQRGVIDSIARTRLTVAPAVAAAGSGGTGSGGTPSEQTAATIYGEVEIHFHTER